METDIEPIRAFCVSADGTAIELVGSEARIRAMGISPALSAAVDILMDNNAHTHEIIQWCVAAERNGDDPEAFARHLVKLRKGVKNFRAG